MSVIGSTRASACPRRTSTRRSLNTIVSHASQLAGAAGCSIYEYDEGAEQFELRATYNYDAEFVEALRAAPLGKGEGLMGRAAEMREPVQIPDITQPGAYQSSVRDTLIRFGYRALLSVPLLREDQIIGSLSFNRVPGQHVARAAHPAQRHHRLLRGFVRGDVRRDQ